MEPEKQLSIWQDAASAALIISSGETAAQTIDFACRLMSEASSQDPQLLSLQPVPISLSMARLEIWVYSLAAELTRQWQTFSSPTPSVESILADLGLIGTEGLPPLIDAIGKADTQTFPIVELRERLQTLYKHQQQEKLVSSKFRLWLEREASQLADWFHQMPTADSLLVQSPEEMGGCLVKLQLYAPTLHTQALQTLNAYFTQLRPLGTQVILTHLNRLRQALQDTLNRYELKRQEHLRRESGAWRAYRNLITQIETRQWGSADQGALAWEAVFRALNLIYVSKLEAEAYALASQIINNLMLQTHQYATEIAQTDTLLTHLHNWFVQQCPPESSLSPVLKSFLAERINSWELRGQLEKWTGYSLHHWGNVSSLRLEILGEQILTRLQPICLAIYGECCASLALGISASNIQLINLGASSQKPSHLNLIL